MPHTAEGVHERRLSFQGPLDLDATLYSGQAFRWKKVANGRHKGWIANVPVVAWLEDANLRLRSAGPLPSQTVRRFFRLDGSHEEFLKAAPKDEHFVKAHAAFPGLRLLRQDPWEMLVSFVVSQNSNEAKIRGSIEKLAALAGEPIEFDGDTLRRFPTPHALSRLGERQLHSTGLGYRAAYVRETARRVNEGDLDPESLASAPYEDAFQRLLDVPGIGEKVADCVLLYGCGHLGAFPTDVWVRRLVEETYYRPRKRPSHERLREFAWKRFGPSAGYAQHYLFHYRRTVGRLDGNPA